MIEETRKLLVNLLHDGVVTVKFTKNNGDERIMKCTLSPDYLPIVEESEETVKRTKAENPEVLAVWDLDKSAWRSFRYDSVLEVTI